MIIVTIVISGCTKTPQFCDNIDPTDYTNATWKWHDPLPYTVQQNLIHWFDLMGPDQTISNELIYRMENRGIMEKVPDSIIPDIEYYYKSYFSTLSSSFMILDVKKDISYPTLFQGRTNNYCLKVVSPQEFKLAEVVMTIPTVSQFGILLLYLVYIVFSLMLFSTMTSKKTDNGGLILLLVAVLAVFIIIMYTQTPIFWTTLLVLFTGAGSIYSYKRKRKAINAEAIKPKKQTTSLRKRNSK